ncbi:MAG: CDP-glycerol glycerophosphotransferase family protein [Anaerolineaceae bacterium]|nr:MAG: CDP-glycerol glycerophosphotransferase family protein [Anaerolineaceae bacterium]
MNILKQLVLPFYKLLTKVLPINHRIILFESNVGRNYTGNPKAIYEEMLRLSLDKKYRCYFILEDMKTNIPGSAKKIKKNRFRYFYFFAIAGIWISDTRFPKYIIKREETIYIQTWHGTPLKKLALDLDAVYMSGETSLEDYKRNFYDNVQTWDYLISQNNYSTEIFKKAFGFKKEILEIGYPRNDILFRKNKKEEIYKIKEMLGLPQDKRIILYAPTWRDNEFYSNGIYKFNTGLDFMLLMKELKEDTVWVVKYHYLIQDKIDWSAYEGFVYTYDKSYDISLLYLASDILVTDYSSVMFDYSILKRPMLFYCYDLCEYKDTLRGFYFDFMKEAPGPVVETTQTLIQSIKEYDYDLYKERYEAFITKYNHADDGNASGKIIDLICK